MIYTFRFEAGIRETVGLDFALADLQLGLLEVFLLFRLLPVTGSHLDPGIWKTHFQ